MVFEGRKQADAIIGFLRAEYPNIFYNARVRVYGNPGLRQTRWIVGSRQLTVDDIRKGARPADAAARCAWSEVVCGFHSGGSDRTWSVAALLSTVFPPRGWFAFTACWLWSDSCGYLWLTDRACRGQSD